MSHLIFFNFETSEIRVVEVDNEPWFVLSDVLKAMQTATTVTSIKAMIEEGLGQEFVSNQPLETAGGVQNVLITNEPGLTFVLSRSKTELGKKMNRWIHVEVLPSIRKNGFYINKGAVQNTDQLTQLMMNMQQQLMQMESRFVNFESEKEQWDIQKSKLESQNAKLEYEKEQRETRISKYEAEIVELETESKLLVKQREVYLEDQLQLQKVYNQLPGLKAAIESAKAMPDEQLVTFTLKEFLDKNFPNLNIERGQKINIGRTVTSFCKLAKIQLLPKYQNNHTLYDKRFEPMMAIATLLELGLLKTIVQ